MTVITTKTIGDPFFDITGLNNSYYWSAGDFKEANVVIDQRAGTLGTPVFEWEESFNGLNWDLVFVVTIGTPTGQKQMSAPRQRIILTTAGGVRSRVSIEIRMRR